MLPGSRTFPFRSANLQTVLTLLHFGLSSARKYGVLINIWPYLRGRGPEIGSSPSSRFP